MKLIFSLRDLQKFFCYGRHRRGIGIEDRGYLALSHRFIIAYMQIHFSYVSEWIGVEDWGIAYILNVSFVGTKGDHLHLEYKFCWLK